MKTKRLHQAAFILMRPKIFDGYAAVEYGPGCNTGMYIVTDIIARIEAVTPQQGRRAREWMGLADRAGRKASARGV